MTEKLNDWTIQNIRDSYTSCDRERINPKDLATDVDRLIAEIYRQRKLIGNVSQDFVHTVAQVAAERLDMIPEEERLGIGYDIANRSLGILLYQDGKVA